MATGIDLNGKVALVTGANSGIGEGIAKLFASLGAHLSLSGRNEQRLQAVKDECEKLTTQKAKISYLPGDLTNEEYVKTLVEETIKIHGKLDILVNNAGTFVQGNIETTSLEDFDKCMDINLRTIYHLTMLAVPHLLVTKGNIVNISSINSKTAFADDLPYNLAKCALDHLTRTTALQLAPKGVRANSVNPGVIRTPIFQNCGMTDEETEQYLEETRDTHAMGRIGTVEEVARAVAFLASDWASFVTGNSIFVDGGCHVMAPDFVVADRK